MRLEGPKNIGKGGYASKYGGPGGREGGKEEGGYNMIRFKRSRPAKSQNCLYVVSVLETLRGEYRTIT